MIQEGQKAPEFRLDDQYGKEHSLREYKGRKVALYFYPKDDTPGCTAQGCSIRDSFAALKEKGIIVLGVSKDSVESHKKFSGKFGFNFPILSDPDGKVIEKYGVWKEKSMYGKTFMGIARTTFLIDENGIIVKVIGRPDTANHAGEIIRGFGL
ncbi:MAG: thioredoxin-dependent thiol peroxidase [Candidatus Diapherotrites archaeon]|uniref:thioredoxin-dependent peroxiredoxin n=1 Tax=Candidatus Iainarchaeum sp. TaxID=3101447 RepID=A0A8T3YNS9_9ARCH|nr:thioredoxin-dependent thiol peroxidase [Candidatus Diapherotrites archaeon]